MKNCLFVGRFQPLHNGHLAAIKWNIDQGRKVTIVIGSTQESMTWENPFSFEERKTMVEASISGAGIKGIPVIGLADVGNDEKWAANLLEAVKLPAAEVVVSSLNPWVRKVCQKAGIATVEHPVFLDGLSATFIRETIAKHGDWQRYVPLEIASWLMANRGDERIISLSNPK